MAAVLGGSIVDFSFDLPISVFAVCFGMGMLAWFAISLEVRPHHLVIWGSLILCGLIPVWDGVGDRLSVAWLPIGVATIAAGVFDHRALVHMFGSPHGLQDHRSGVSARSSTSTVSSTSPDGWRS